VAGHRTAARRGGRGFSVCALVLLLAGLPMTAAASEVNHVRRQSVSTDSIGARRAAMRTRVYFGMWSTHILDINRGLGANSLIAVAWRGWFGGTFINSYGDRSVAIGVQRSLTPARPGAVTTSLGYRAGVVTGYDERLFGIGQISPVLPFAQLTGSVDWRNLGCELAYSGIVASVMLNVRL